MSLERKLAHKILILASLTWFIGLGSPILISSLLAPLEAALHINHALAGLALTVHLIIYAIAQVLGGIIADSKGKSGVILVSVILLSTSLLLIGSTVHYLQFLPFMALLGLARGGYRSSGCALLSDLFPQQVGKAMGVHIAVASLAGVIIPIFTAAVLPYFGWRMPFYTFAALSLTVFFPLLGSLTRESLSPLITLGEVDSSPTKLSGLVKNRSYLTSIVLLSLPFIAVNGLFSFLPIYLIEAKQLTIAQANFLYSLFFLVGIGSQIILGRLSDRLGRRLIISLLLIISIIALLLLYSATTLAFIIISILILSIFRGYTPVTDSLVMRILPQTVKATGYGTARAAFTIIGSAGPFFIGLVANYFSISISFILVSLSSLLLPLLLLNVPRFSLK